MGIHLNVIEGRCVLINRSRKWFGSLLPFIAAIHPALAEQGLTETGLRHLTLDDMSVIQAPYSPRISPDGRKIIYLQDDQIHLVSATAADARSITSSAVPVWGGRWSTSSDAIYFLSDRGSDTQLYKLAIDQAGEAVQLSHFQDGVSPIALSHDESKVLLSASDNDLREKSEEEESEPFVITRRHFKRDSGDGYIVEGDNSHLYVYDIASKKMVQITTGEYVESSGAWSPDGETIVFSSYRQQEMGVDYGHRMDLWAVSSTAEEGGAPLRRLTDSARVRYSPEFSPDGRQIAYLTAENGVYGAMQVAVISADGGEERILTTQNDRNVRSFKYGKDGEWIYFAYPDSGAAKLSRVRIRDGKIEKMVGGDQTVHSFDVSDSGIIAFDADKENLAGNIYSLRRGKVTQVTDHNREFFDQVQLGEKTKVRIDGTDGTRIDTFITTPPDYEPGHAYPAILKIHGGPQSQFEWGFGFDAQYYASQGYVVIEPNPRGSTGRGQDFLNSIYQAWGVPDYLDVMAAVDYAIEQGIADPEKLAVTGFSYGGYMTNVVITETDRFKAAASGAGGSHAESMFGHDMYLYWYLWELGVPWENREKYDVFSPFLRAGNVTTPTMFLGGRIDWNMPISNAEIFYQALKVQDIDSELIVYPEMHHGGWPDRFWKDYLTRVVGWFDNYIEK